MQNATKNKVMTIHETAERAHKTKDIIKLAALLSISNMMIIKDLEIAVKLGAKPDDDYDLWKNKIEQYKKEQYGNQTNF